MMYPKINSLWKRDEQGKIIEGDYSCQEFLSVKHWVITEKIDGMNIRIIFKDGKIDIKGRTNNAQIPHKLKLYIDGMLNEKIMGEIFKGANEVILFGEGYGGKIQSGGLYSEEEKFILFDVWIDGWWLEFDKVFDIGIKLGIEIVPTFGVHEKEFVINKVRNGFNSLLSMEKQAEGMVAKSYPLMFNRKGELIMWKLKTKDFHEVKK